MTTTSKILPRTTVLCGMGGTGKSLMAVLAVQSPEVRRAFAKICFATLGATPNVSALQQTLHLQLTGGEGLPENVRDQEHLALQALEEAARKQSSKGRGILLILDDIWAPEDERSLNFLSKTANSPPGSR